MEIPNFQQIRNLQETKRVLNQEKKLVSRDEIIDIAQDPETIEVNPEDGRKEKKEAKPFHATHENINPETTSEQLIKKFDEKNITEIHLFQNKENIFDLLSH